MNDGKTEAAWAFKIERAVVNEDAVFWGALSDGQGDAEDAFFRLARVDVTGAEENLEALAEVEGFDAVLIEFERFVVDGADEIFAGVRAGIENGAAARKFL